MISVGEVLDLPAAAAGIPHVVAGRGALGTPVRWVHVSEVADIAHLLQGGELILTTGIALPDDPAKLRRYIEELREAGACGVVVELGRHFARLPPEMVAAAERAGMPLVELRREVRFVSITEAVHSRIVYDQFDQLERAKEVHEVFTALSLEGASATEIVDEVATRARCPAVLENLSHQVLAHAGEAAEELLANWERRSRAVSCPDRTSFDPGEGWLVTRVSAQGEPWGRLVLVVGGDPTEHQVLVVERGASALAIERLVEQNRESLERQVHRGLLADLLDHAGASASSVAARSAAVGVPLERRHLVGVVVRFHERGVPGPMAAQARDLRRGEAVARAARLAKVLALVGTVSPSEVGLLCSFHPRSEPPAALRALARHLRQELGAGPERSLVVAAGSVVDHVRDARRSLQEAQQVASVADPQVVTPRGYVELPDVRVRGLLYVLRNEPRLQAFVERELGPLLLHDAAHPEGRLVEALGALCSAGGNVAKAARAFGLSRASFYHRLARIEEVLDVRLDSVESQLSLHVAVLALGTIRGDDRLGGSAEPRGAAALTRPARARPPGRRVGSP